ncbi:peptide deformylase [Tritonibacter horizontis]|uniref:Peptide deformylase n=1 Tax=Tritonibacter horizontis TaxID=1768241 RepID=A0A132C1J5_9RHOB|nr:peptide deformylase [Tritonibacter horizontis]KUP94122.1 peptide deformylase [Tritonibacter horizontis]
MSLRPIVTWPDARLSTVCTAVDPAEDLSDLIADMLETMYDAPGRGLAAPQVGVLKRLFVMDVAWKDGPAAPVVMINPDILWHSDDLVAAQEGCLSIPGVSTEVYRPTEVRLRWQDAGGAWHEDQFDGFAARCIQHEYDHLEGRVTFDHLAPEARQAAEDRYHTQKDAPR